MSARLKTSRRIRRVSDENEESCCWDSVGEVDGQRMFASVNDLGGSCDDRSEVKEVRGRDPL
jgi:hypothetical protein